MNTRFFIMSIVLSYSIASATIINVPADSLTIQGGINGSSDGDTVLVQPGTYVENVNFNGHNIVLGSLFLTTGDTSYISQTILDGDSAGSVVTFGSGEDSTAAITGITIQNGYSGHGGGIRCYPDCSPVISNNIIRRNEVYDSGGGISCGGDPGPKIISNVIIENTTHFVGGGIKCNTGVPLISNNTITGNFALYYGGGICGEGMAYPIIVNNILWGNLAAESGNEIGSYSSPPLDASFCNIQDTLWPGEGNISCDPQFCEPSSENFELNAFSCCVGAGQNGVDIGARGIGCYNCEGYVIGDANNSGGYNGLDIIYGVSYLKGGPPPQYECICAAGNIWYASGDVNGSCSYNGLDITYGVSYLKGENTELLPCPDCPPVR